MSTRILPKNHGDHRQILLTETQDVQQQGAPPQRNLARPSSFFWVALPYAIYIGFVTNGGLSLLLRQAGMSVDKVADAIALLGIPSSIYFLWSPLADIWMPRRFWHLLSTIGSAAAMAIGAFALKHDPNLSVWIFFAGLIFCMLISSAYGGLIASMLTPGSRTRAAAWAQASNLGGGAIGPGIILWLAIHYRVAIWGPLAALLVLLPGMTVLFLREPKRQPSPAFRDHLQHVGRELKVTCLTPANLVGLVLLLSPPGGGALIGLLPAISPDYHVSGGAVVWINGIGGGLIMAIGCLFGTLVPAATDKRLAYALAGVLNAGPSLFVALAPATYNVYVSGTIVYLFTIGFTSALSMALVLDVVGAVGKSGSLRFSILMALGYVPTAYMTWVEGFASKSYGFRGVPMVEAISSVVDLPLILFWIWWRRRDRLRRGTPSP